jgi:hypothetical protein
LKCGKNIMGSDLLLLQISFKGQCHLKAGLAWAKVLTSDRVPQLEQPAHQCFASRSRSLH